MEIYSLENKKPNKDGADCIVWTGYNWRHLVWCEIYKQFLTTDMDKYRRKVDLWFYAPEPKANTEFHGEL